MITNFDELLCNAEQILSKRSLSPVTIDQYLAGMRQIFKIARALGHQSCSHEFLMHYLQTRENYYLFLVLGRQESKPCTEPSASLSTQWLEISQNV